MSIAQNLSPEFEHEATTTRTVLARVPEAKFAWQPHAKSMSLHDLAAHVANILAWGPMTITTAEFDVATPFEPRRFATTAALLAAFDRNVADCRTALANATDADLFANWTFRAGPKVFFTQPKVAVLRGFVMNHLIHHRGQLAVYLRLLDVPVPSIYGPSADDDPMGFGKKP